MMTRVVATICLTGLLLGGCTPPAGGAARPTPKAVEPVLQPGGATSPPSVDASLGARPSAPAKAILIDDDGSGQHLRARPIDPKTLADVPGYVPISFGHHYFARVSPDGRTIAAILWPGGSSTGPAKVHLIDTARWIDRELETPITNYTTAIRFDERGTIVYWTQPNVGEPTPSLFALDVASGRIREIARLSQGFYARDMITFDESVAVFLMPANGGVGAAQQPKEAPRIALVNTSTGRVVQVPLPVRAGAYLDSTAPADEPFRSIEPGLAWDLPRGKVYVADAESDRVFVMDLRRGSIEGPFDPKPKRSMLDVLWSIFGSVANAKMTSASRQNAEISRDGTRLYLTGLRSDFAKAGDGKYHETVTPRELRTIDTSDMSELSRQSGATTPLWLSPDGASLLFGDNAYDQSVEGYAVRSDFKLHLVDTRRADVRVSLPIGGQPMLHAFDRGSHTAFVGVQHFSGGSLGNASLSLIDLGSRSVVNSRVIDSHFVDLLLLGYP